MPRHSIAPRVAKIRSAILAIEELCAGTLVHARKACGKPTCRCAKDPAARHGPYYVWSRLERGRLVRTSLTPKQAERLRIAIQNERRVQRLLTQWGRETGRAILSSDARNP